MDLAKAFWYFLFNVSVAVKIEAATKRPRSDVSLSIKVSGSEVVLIISIWCSCNNKI
jgi:hypothetical protein